MDDSITITIVVVVGFLAVFFLILLCVCLAAPHETKHKKRKRRKKFRPRGNDLRNEDVEYYGNEDDGNDLQMNCDYEGSNDDFGGGYNSGRGNFVGASDY